MVECKNKGAISWWSLCKDQLWEEAVSIRNSNSRAWVVANIGFEICFFRFDQLDYDYSSDWFTNFSPLNIRNFDEDDLQYLGLEPIIEDIDGVNVIQVIKWRLDNPSHRFYIDEMFLHIKNNAP